MINNINTLQNLPESSGLSTYTDLYLKQSLANLGQRFSVKGDGLHTGEFSIYDILDIDYDEKEINFYTEYKPLFIGSFIDKLSFKFNLQKGYLLGFVICLGIAALIKYYYVNIKKKAKKGYLRNSPDVIDGLITAQEI